MKKDRKYHYDEDQGIFVFDDEISINWLLSEVLKQPNLQISKISNDELNIFLSTLSKSELRMQDGTHSLYWLKQQLKEKNLLAESKTGLAWHETSTRFKYIIRQIDFILMTNEIKEKLIEEKKISKRDLNNMKAYFEPL